MGLIKLIPGGGSKFALNDSLFSDRYMSFMNRASVNMRGRHSGNVFSNIFYDRTDYWDHNMDNRIDWQTLGGILIQKGPVVSPYTRAEFTTRNLLATHYEYEAVGANVQFNPNLLVYGEAGWMSSTIEGQGSTDSWIARTGFRHRLGPYTTHSIDAGRGPINNFANRYLADFVQYNFTQQFGPKTSVTLFAQQADLKSLNGIGAPGDSGERSATTVGLFAQTKLSANATISYNASYEKADLPSIQRAYQLWTHRLMYNRQIGPSANGLIYYQYQEAGAGLSSLDSFSEHLLYVGMVKRF